MQIAKPEDDNEEDIKRPLACLLPKDLGHFSSSIRITKRWFYNVDSNKCELFDYYGGGNENNFATKRSCEMCID
uniref:BPTI/Kunitz inhibitor domain-containing protein n=1 Tax=Romanomermis culicivorax TaxID=13658 RepID=A0A915HVI5_ROMCU